jgi:hypothetical protein
MLPNRSIAIDLIVLLLLVPAHTQLAGIDFLLGLALLVYTGLELWHPLASYSSLPERFNKTRFTFLAKLFLLYIMIVAACLIPASERIVNRLTTKVDAEGYSPAFGQMHDGALQVESALEFLVQGKNPYVELYNETPMRFVGFSGIEMEDNPYFYYLPYLPGLILISTPLYSLSEGLGIAYDQRIIYLAAYIILIFLLPLLAKAPSLKLLLVAAVGLNPLLVGPTIWGMNDVVIAMALVLTVLFIMKRRFLLSALTLGVAVVLKQSAWFFVPFYIVLMMEMVPRQRRLKAPLIAFGVISIIALLAIIPFAVWDFSAFWTDVFSYPSGSAALNYPIRGYTIGNLLVGSGIIESPLDPFPFWILQLLLGMPILLLLIRYQWRRNSIGTMLIAYAFFMFIFGFLSRFFQDNYLGFVTLFITIGLVLNVEPAAGTEPVLKN